MKADLEHADFAVVPEDDRGGLVSSWTPVPHGGTSSGASTSARDLSPARGGAGTTPTNRSADEPPADPLTLPGHAPHPEPVVPASDGLSPTSVGHASVAASISRSSSTSSESDTHPAGAAHPALEWIRRLADGDRLALLNDDDLLAELRVLEEVGRLVDAGRMFAAGLVAQRSDTSKGTQRLCAREGFTKPEDMIAQVTGTSARTVRERIRQAEPLQHVEEAAGPSTDHPKALQLDTNQSVPFPLLRRAVREGLISPDAASVITAALGPARKSGVPALRVAEAECALLAAAMGADAVTSRAHVFGDAAEALLTEVGRSGTQPGAMALTQLSRLARSWSRMLAQESDPDGGQEDSRASRHRREARRFLTIHALREGTRRVEGELLPETAAQLERLLDAYLNPRTETATPGTVDPSAPVLGAAGGARGHGPDPSAAPRSAAGTDPTAGHDPVTGPGTTAGPGPVNAPVLDHRSPRQKRHDALAGILATAAGVPEMPLLGGAAPTLVVTTTADQIGRPNGTAFLQGTHDEADSAVDISVAHHTGCVGAVQKVVMDSRGRIVELMAPQRIFTAHQRRAIATRDGGCVIPGCSVPVTWCEIHHVREWHEGGDTHTDNGVALCWHHHRSFEQLGWDIQMRDGVPWVRPPATIDRRRRWFRAQSGLHLMFGQLAVERAVLDAAAARDDRSRSPGGGVSRRDLSGGRRNRDGGGGHSSRDRGGGRSTQDPGDGGNGDRGTPAHQPGGAGASADGGATGPSRGNQRAPAPNVLGPDVGRGRDDRGDLGVQQEQDVLFALSG